MGFVMELNWLSIILALMFTGLISGVFAGLLGVGGGIVIVPVLFFFFQFLGISAATSMSVATGTSLLVIVVTSMASTRAHYKKGNMDIRLLKFWSPFMIVGALLGGLLAVKVGGLFASVVFGIVAILAAMNMLFRASASALLRSLPNKCVQAVLATTNGAVSVIMGVGGGTLGVPILTACNYSAHRATGTSAAFGLLIALPGVLFLLFFTIPPEDAPPATIGFINVLGFACIAPLSVAAAPVGVKIGSLVDDLVLKRLFAVFLCLSGVRMLYQAILM